MSFEKRNALLVCVLMVKEREGPWSTAKFCLLDGWALKGDPKDELRKKAVARTAATSLVAGPPVFINVNPENECTINEDGTGTHGEMDVVLSTSWFERSLVKASGDRIDLDGHILCMFEESAMLSDPRCRLVSVSHLSYFQGFPDPGSTKIQ